MLNDDCLWVFDEPQLMASGVSTSAQLAGLRHPFKKFGECPLVWVSATLEPSWLNAVDFRDKFPAPPLELDTTDYATPALDRRMTAVKTFDRLSATSSKDMKDVAKAVLKAHEAGTQTPVVLSTVDRAKAVFAARTDLREKSPLPKLLPVHSRFRPYERAELNRQLQERVKRRRIGSLSRRKWSKRAWASRRARRSRNWLRGRASCSASAGVTAPVATAPVACSGSTSMRKQTLP